MAVSLTPRYVETPPEGPARWTIRLIAEEAVKRRVAPRAGREMIRILLQSHDFKPWREKMWCAADLTKRVPGKH